MTHSIDDNKWMHFFAGKESALLELLNNFTNKLSDEIKDELLVRIKDNQRKHSNIFNKTNKDCLELHLKANKERIEEENANIQRVDAQTRRVK